MKTLVRFTLKVLPLTVMLCGCYVVPMDWQGNPVWPTPPQTIAVKLVPQAPHKKLAL